MKFAMKHATKLATKHALLLTAALVCGACAAEKESPAQAPTPAAVQGADGAAWKMASIIGIGDIAISDTALTTSDGQEIPLQKVADGVYAMPSGPSELTNGESFCFTKRVYFFTWHKHDEGLWVMNVGDWQNPPGPPPSNTWEVPGACGLSTYEPA